MAACSLRTDWAFSPSLQKSGRDATRLSSSRRFCLASRSKTPPEQLQAFVQVVQLLFGLVEHLFLIRFHVAVSAVGKTGAMIELNHYSLQARLRESAASNLLSRERMIRSSLRERS